MKKRILSLALSLVLSLSLLPMTSLATYNVPELITSPWAEQYAEKADEYGLIPDCLDGADLVEPITRGEFAALAVKLYEAISCKTATACEVNPFTDTADAEVLKAYNIGIIDGIGGGKFAPAQLVTREQAATMLTRVYKASYWEGWTLEGDGRYTRHSIVTSSPHGDTVYLNIARTAADESGGQIYTATTIFADDADISGWAKDSVYFMAVNNIIDGIGNNLFAPNTANIPAGAVNYGRTTREAALKIAMVSYENLRNK